RPGPRAGARSAPALSAAQSGGVVNFAMQFRGVPYVWGGASPSGFDCSGFTRYVYAQFGLHLPHSAAGQYSQRYGTFIDRANLQPGDIVFFANTYKRGISHVGIYIGGGMVVQALAPGTSLSAVSINGSYWNSKYYGALRPNL
ncbi:MAG: C40 family peptidase, partial [Oscillochloris sp.]|nr:C40 family peptidase [Oscillochloris sp.]